MKIPIERRKPRGLKDYFALALTTFGVGFIPGAPGTYGSIVAVGIYVLVQIVMVPIDLPGICFLCGDAGYVIVTKHALVVVSLLLFCLAGIWASGRSIPLLGNDDPSEAVIDEVMGQLITFLFIPFIPFDVGWPFILAGFLLFRLFDIWKPYPIRDLEILPGGLGICADDIIAGVYAGVCLAVGYALYLNYLVYEISRFTR